MKRIFRILDRGNFYFPVIDKGKEFIVEDTIDVTLDKKYTELIKKCFVYKDDLIFGMLANPIWDALRKVIDKKYKNYWFVPICLYKIGEGYVCSIDILKRVISKKKK